MRCRKLAVPPVPGVQGSTEIAREFAISETAIGLTIVAVGTSLPEMTTILVAAWRRQADIAYGNIVGSNIFNILFVLGHKLINRVGN